MKRYVRKHVTVKSACTMRLMLWVVQEKKALLKDVLNEKMS